MIALCAGHGPSARQTAGPCQSNRMGTTDGRDLFGGGKSLPVAGRAHKSRHPNPMFAATLRALACVYVWVRGCKPESA